MTYEKLLTSYQICRIWERDKIDEYDEVFEQAKLANKLAQAAACFKYLQSISAKDAQAFFWNHSSRTERRKAIQKAIAKEPK